MFQKIKHSCCLNPFIPGFVDSTHEDAIALSAQLNETAPRWQKCNTLSEEVDPSHNMDSIRDAVNDQLAMDKPEEAPIQHGREETPMTAIQFTTPEEKSFFEKLTPGHWVLFVEEQSKH